MKCIWKWATVICVPICSWLCKRKDRVNNVSIPGKSTAASLNLNIIPETACNPASFISRKINVSCKWPGSFCYCWCYDCGRLRPCLRAWFWSCVPRSPPVGTCPLSPTFPSCLTQPFWCRWPRQLPVWGVAVHKGAFTPEIPPDISRWGWFSNFESC